MKTLLLALVALVLTLLLPALIVRPDGTPYLTLQNQNPLSAATYTTPYDQLIKNISTLSNTPHEETVQVYTWEDYRSMHFSDQFDQSVARKVRPYLIRDTFTGRFVIPHSWVATTMLAVWLLCYGSGNFLIWGFERMTKGTAPRAYRPSRHQKNSDSEKNHANTNNKTDDFAAGSHSSPSPYQILGITAGVGADEITKAYRKRIMEYHPDRVAHLGIELQEFARKKTIELNQAYEMLGTC